MTHYSSLVQPHMQTEAASRDAGCPGPATKRPRVEEVLQQHAPREQLLVSELMGWRGSSQESLSTMGTAAASIGLTDFRTLYARQPSQQHLAQQRAPNAATTGLRTFTDVASRSAMTPDDVGRQELLGALRAAYNTAGPSTCSQLGRSGAAQHALPRPQDATGMDSATGLCNPGATAASGANALEDLTLEQLPMDWGIKRSLTFTSFTRFGIHDRAQQAPPRTRWRALQNIVNSDLDTIGDEVLQYLSSQLSWRHPEVLMDASAFAAARSASAASLIGAGGTALANATPGSIGSGSGSWLAQRLVAWRSALHSLYGTYRGGDCNVFYVINSAARNPFVALFAYKGVRGSSELCAVVSQSTRVLRGRMLAAGVPFSMPLEKAAGSIDAAAASRAAGGATGNAGYEAGPAAAGQDGHPDEDVDAVLCDKGPQASPAQTGAQLLGSSVADNSRGSLLLLRGPRAVHGLYDFLMNDTALPELGGRLNGSGAGPGDEFNDLPLLLAPVPFDGGAVCRPTIKALTLNGKLAGGSVAKLGLPTTQPQAGASSESESGTVLHVLQLSGLLAPWTVRRFCSLMARLQPSGYNATLEAEPCSITLNSRVIEAHPGSDGSDSGTAAQVVRPTFAQGGALTLEELVAWQQPVVLPGGRPVKVVMCNDVRRMSVRV
ncbi:hypothetical protein VaNZ11_013823 [Volvox africanus]|uniref:TLDc domain-containing protein n=1 Tax=Volvox africanus TaxID=51714 RepID=A0ABQ5SIR7_9CHLO|nr:hypothetical protein VaNZ11_013823 [Volvox africanus]